MTRALGTDETISPDARSFELSDGDQLLLCSDGLSNKIEDHEIKQMLQAESDHQEKVDLLISKANQNGGEDNITAVLIEFSADAKEGEDKC